MIQIISGVNNDCWTPSLPYNCIATSVFVRIYIFCAFCFVMTRESHISASILGRRPLAGELPARCRRGTGEQSSERWSNAPPAFRRSPHSRGKCGSPEQFADGPRRTPGGTVVVASLISNMWLRAKLTSPLRGQLGKRSVSGKWYPWDNQELHSTTAK